MIEERCEWRTKPRGMAPGGRARASRGFTLLELVLVMILICTALAVSAPDLRGFMGGSRMKNAAMQVLALTNYAKTQSASEGRVYRLNVEGESYYLTAEKDGQFEEQANGMGQVFKVPEGVQLQLTKDGGAGGSYIEFYPDGRAETGWVRLTHEDSQLYVVCQGPSERFRIASKIEGGGR